MKKRVFAILMTFVMVFSMLPTTVLAVQGEGTTIDLSEGSYTIETAGTYTVSAYTGANTLTVKADATITLAGVNITAAADTSAISIESGNVTLVIADDSTMTGGDNGAGIYVAEGASVTIQSENNAKLTAIGNAGADDNSGAAGIGGTWVNGNSGAITIDGATVVAEGYGVHGSGIGSGSGKVVGEIKIVNGANVTAYGGYYANGVGTKLQSSYGKSDPEGSAAIGGGGKTASTIANITITDSIVVANGGSKAAGIGANFWCSTGTITISGNSNVTAQGGSSSAGIGTSRAGDSGVSANIIISGGTVTATGGDYGAGIGAGYNADSLGNGASVSGLPETSITISDGVVTATGGEGGAGIGGGYKSDNVDIDITGGSVSAAAGALVSGKTVENGGSACGIGSGANGSGTFENSPAVEFVEGSIISVTAYEDGKPAIEGVENNTLGDAYDEIKAPRTGTVTPAYTKEVDGYVRVWGEGGGNAKESFELKLYAGDTLIATTKLNNIEGIIDGDVYVTWNFYYSNSNDSYWTTIWEEGHPNSVAQPTKVELYIDGVKGAENVAKMSAPDDLNPVVWRELGGVEQADLVETDGVYTINNLKELQIFRNTVNAGNNYQGKTVKLTADIDLNGEEWIPIGTSKNPFNGTFDGQNHTISNLVITGSNSDVGLFGRTNNGEVKNLTVNNAKVSGYLNVGVVAGTPYTTKYTNITVSGHVEVNGYAYVGGVGGKNAYANWTNVTVNADDTSYVKADSENYRTYVGGVIGFMGEGGHTFQNISSNIDVTGSTCDVGGITGIAHYGNKFINVTCSGDVTTLVDNVVNACESGGIAGVWHNGGSPVTFEELTYTGTLSAPNVEEEFTFPNSGLIGAPYSSTGTGTIVGDIAAVGSKTYSSLEEAILDAEEGQSVVVLRNHGDNEVENRITIAKQQNVTIDLNGYSLNVEGFHNKGTLNIKNGSLAGSTKDYSTVESTGTLTLTDVDVTGVRHAVRIEGGTAIIDGGEYKLSGTSGMTTHAINVSDGGEVTIKDGTFTGPKGTVSDSGAAVNVQAGSTVNIQGGNFSGGKNHTLASKGTLSLTGGTYDQDPSVYVAEGYVAAFDENTNTYFVYAPAIQVTYPVGNPVYPEGKVEYYNDMLEAVPYTTNCPRLEGATVTLLTDIEAPGIRMMENDMVLDLNGHTYTITAGTGSQGTNTSGFQIRPEVTTVATIKNGTIKVAEGAPVVWMFNVYATGFIVDDVTVDCANMAYSYGESCYVSVSRSGDNVQFTGTTNIINFNSEIAGDVINVGDTMTIEDTVVLSGTIELDADATLTAREGLNVVSGVDGYGVVYNNGVYSLVACHTVTFETNGGSVVVAQEIVSGEKAIKPENPTMAGYTFQGWYSDSGLTTEFSFDTVITTDITVYAKWSKNSSGGGIVYPTVPSYSIKVEDTENGDLKVSHSYADRGQTVTIMVDPDKGYVLETLTVLDKNGKAIELTTSGNGKYTFKMPASKVTVHATFMEDNIMLNYFVDVFASDYYYDAVLWAVENGITNGTSATTFSPDAVCTRAQVVTFLWRAAGSPEPVSTVMPFTDVAADAYYYKAVLWAVENGITNGTGANTFSPDADCTRGQIVTFLWRSQGSENASGYNPFVDVADGAYYEDAVLWAVDEAITNGTGADTFSPDADCTRGQIVTFLYRCLAE